MESETTTTYSGLLPADQMIVEKSKPLIAAMNEKCSTKEFKIFDLYLARINSRNSNIRTVVFEKGDIEEIFGVQRLQTKELEASLKKLMSPVVKIPDSSSPDQYRLIPLFDLADVKKDDFGLWQVTLRCSEDVRNYIFNIQNIGYIRYRLHSIMTIRQKSSYTMFLYLKNHAINSTWTIGLENLKKKLGYTSDSCFDSYKIFNQKILKKAQQELKEKIGCIFSYEPVKKSRTVVAITFTLIAMPVDESDCKDILSENNGKQPDTDDATDMPNDTEQADIMTEPWVSAVKIFNFSTDELEYIRSILVCIPEECLPPATSSELVNNLPLLWYHYMNQKAHQVITADRKSPIKNKLAYLLKLLKVDMNS